MKLRKIKKLGQYSALSIIVLFCTSASVATGETCNSVDECIERIHELAKKHSPHSLDSEESALIKQTVSLKGAVVDRLVVLLADPDRKVAELAAAVLRDVDSIDKKYLPQIIAGLDRNLGWLPVALGRIDSPEAAQEAVKRYLVSESAPQNQEAFAVELSGKRAIPFILEAARCEKTCGENDHYLLGYALGQMGEAERSDAAKELIEMAKKAEKTDIARKIISMISDLGKPGLVVETELLQLREHRPYLKAEINRAFIGIQSKHATQVFIDTLENEPNVVVLRDLSGIGKAGHDAGPSVLKLLQHSDWDIRLGAVTTLGFIRYENAVPKLIVLLKDPTDVRLNWAAAKALGQIKSQSAKSALTETANNHWHTAVRKMASDALIQLEAKASDEDQAVTGNFAFLFFGYENLEIEPCDAITLAFVKETNPEKLRYDESKKKLQSLSYKSEVVSYGVSSEEEEKQKKAGKDIIEVTSGNMVRHVESIDQVPGIALRVKDGWLGGSNRGEWGGELVFIKDDGVSQKIIDENVEDIYLLGDRYIAVAGLAHMGSNNGMLYELASDKSGQWSARPWRSLPGAPRSSGPVQSGEILLNTSGGGSILVSKDGRMRMATCSEK